MHLGNGIICPVTGIPMIGLMAGFGIYAFKKAKNEFNTNMILPIISTSIFVFALQMINFSIPQAISSGHIIGGLLLCILLGKYMGFLSMAVILLVQSLIFNDGSLLAYGCNLFNMGFLACFLVYPFIFESLKKRNKYLAALLSSIIAIELGSACLGIELLISGSLKGEFLNFSALLEAINLPIGIVEGIFSAGILYLLNITDKKKISYILIVISGILTIFGYKYISTKPDSLEWSLLNTPISYINNVDSFITNIAIFIQSKISLLNPTLSNIIGILALASIMLVMCQILAYKKDKLNAK